MNYIAHLQLAHHSQTSLLGNFLGDFVKGSKLLHLEPDLHHGITLHRNIDTYTDSHELTRTLRRSFPDELRRMSGVILDIYFDHLLCRHWHRYSDTDLDKVLSLFYDDLGNSSLEVSGRYAEVKKGLLAHKWLRDYEDPKACLRAFINIEKRLKFKISFAQDGYQFVNDNRRTIEEAFLDFYPQLSSAY